jgi:hypothetical protein
MLSKLVQLEEGKWNFKIGDSSQSPMHNTE